MIEKITAEQLVASGVVSGFTLKALVQIFSIIALVFIGFYNGDTRVAYFSSQKLYITQADITTTLRIGTSTAEGGQGYLVFTTVKETGVTITWSNT